MKIILYNELERLAKNKMLASYGEVSPLVGLSMDIGEHRDKMAALLGEIARHEHENKRPMLTALIVHKGSGSNPGEEFYSIAAELENFKPTRNKVTRLTFWARQVTKVHKYWAGDQI